MLPWRDQDRLVALEEALVRAAQRAEGAGPAGPALERLSEAYNALAMRLVGAGQFPGAHELLRKAEALTEEASPSAGWAPAGARRRLHAVTLNNLGCYYKRRGKLNAALGYLEEALALEEGEGGWAAGGGGPEAGGGRLENPAGTLLNICATLGALGRHREAAGFAARALRMALGELGVGLGGEDGGRGEAEEEALRREERALERAAARGGGSPGGEGAVATVAMAYHNLATQQEALGEGEAALKSYGRATRAVKLCRGGLGAEVGHSVQRAHRNFARHYREALRRAGRGAGSGPGNTGGGGAAAAVRRTARPHSAAPPQKKQPLAPRPQPHSAVPPARAGRGRGGSGGKPERPASAKQTRVSEIYLRKAGRGEGQERGSRAAAVRGRASRPASAPPRPSRRPDFQL